MGTTCMPRAQGGQRGHLIPWNWNYRLLWAATWVLGIDPQASARAAYVPNHWTISPANTHTTLKAFPHFYKYFANTDLLARSSCHRVFGKLEIYDTLSTVSIIHMYLFSISAERTVTSMTKMLYKVRKDDMIWRKTWVQTLKVGHPYQTSIISDESFRYVKSGRKGFWKGTMVTLINPQLQGTVI